MAIYIGTSGVDTILGSALNDTINGLEGNDALTGLAGNDRINGDGGNDAGTASKERGIGRVERISHLHLIYAMPFVRSS